MGFGLDQMEAEREERVELGWWPSLGGGWWRRRTRVEAALVAGGSTWWFRPKREREREREREICWNELMREKMNGEGFI